MFARNALLPRTLGRMERDFGSLMDRFFNPEDGDWFPVGEKFLPTANVVETDAAVEATFELPGLKPEDIHLEVLEGRLVVWGVKQESMEEKEKTFHRIERRYGEFRRVLPLPAPVSEENVEATYKDGVLKVVLPKTEAARPRKITIKSE